RRDVADGHLGRYRPDHLQDAAFRAAGNGRQRGDGVAVVEAAALIELDDDGDAPSEPPPEENPVEPARGVAGRAVGGEDLVAEVAVELVRVGSDQGGVEESHGASLPEQGACQNPWRWLSRLANTLFFNKAWRSARSERRQGGASGADR